MLSELRAGPFTVKGLSVGGIYTSLHVPELGAVLDVGLAPRSFAGCDHVFLSHGHVDHAGALATQLGTRKLIGKDGAPRLYLPEEIVAPITDMIGAMGRMQRRPLAVDVQPMRPGSEHQLRPDLWVRAFRTYHPVPSLGYQFLRRVSKLRPEFKSLPGDEIRTRRLAGDDLFFTAEHLELAYATDTLVKVLDSEPSLTTSRVLVLECTFLDERKSMADVRAGCHVHLDEIIERADQFQNEHLVLMHFSQMYKPREVEQILASRLPPSLASRTHAFVPPTQDWPG